MLFRSVSQSRYTRQEAIAKGMCDVIDTDCETDAEVAIWANRVVEAVLDEKWRKVHINPDDYSWGKVADKFIEELGLNDSKAS